VTEGRYPLARVQPACRRTPALLMAAYDVRRRAASAAGQLTGLELGRHRHRRDGGAYELELPAAQTKTRIPLALPFPEPQVPALEE
jgi:hypothetical protein